MVEVSKAAAGMGRIALVRRKTAGAMVAASKAATVGATAVVSRAVATAGATAVASKAAATGAMVVVVARRSDR